MRSAEFAVNHHLFNKTIKILLRRLHHWADDIFYFLFLQGQEERAHNPTV